MRPYLAVIRDSFREALASRVLWVLTGMIAVLLVLLAPIGYGLDVTGELAWNDIADGRGLVNKLRNAWSNGQPSPGHRIWSLFDDDTRDKLAKFQHLERGEGRDFFRGMQSLREKLNELIRRREFYSADDWKNVPLPAEAQELIARTPGKLSQHEITRLNRLLIETPFRAYFASRGPQSVHISYFWLTSDPLPIGKSQADTLVKEWVLTSVMGWIVGVFGMIAAILVTSPMIPQMFEPGSITLLLSKPVSRSALLTAKFLGGCAFILLNVTFLIIGLWLIAGLRLGIWNHGMLWCIPIFLFMFLIYYAVSALSGLIWKSAVISVVITVLFWIACFVVDLAHDGINGLALDQQRITRMLQAGDNLVAITEGGRVQVWDEDAKEWRMVAEPRGGRGIPVMHGPLFQAENSQLLVAQSFRNPFGGFGQRMTLRIGQASDGWRLRDGPAVPSGTSAILVASDDSILAVAPDGIYRLKGNPAAKGATVNILGVKVPLIGAEFRRCMADEKVVLDEPIAAAADPEQPRIVVCGGNDVYLFQQGADGNYAVTAKQKLDRESSDGAAVAVAGDLVLVAREDGKLWELSTADLSVKQELVLEPQSQPRFITATPDGSHFAVVFQNRNLWFIEGTSGVASRATIGVPQQVSGAAFAGHHLLVADYANRLTEFDSKTLAAKRVYRPSLSRVEWAYYYIVEPLHTIFPKPRMLNNTVHYVLTGKRTTDLGLFAGDVTQHREDLEPWRPVRSGLAFVGVLLLAACIYIERQEF